jgi:hypothetical protein
MAMMSFASLSDFSRQLYFLYTPTNCYSISCEIANDTLKVTTMLAQNPRNLDN